MHWHVANTNETMPIFTSRRFVDMQPTIVLPCNEPWSTLTCMTITDEEVVVWQLRMRRWYRYCKRWNCSDYWLDYVLHVDFKTTTGFTRHHVTWGINGNISSYRQLCDWWLHFSDKNPDHMFPNAIYFFISIKKTFAHTVWDEENWILFSMPMKFIT